MQAIKLNKEQAELLTKSPLAFLAYSYLSVYPATSLRKLAGLMGLSPYKCKQLLDLHGIELSPQTP